MILLTLIILLSSLHKTLQFSRSKLIITHFRVTFLNSTTASEPLPLPKQIKTFGNMNGGKLTIELGSFNRILSFVKKTHRIQQIQQILLYAKERDQPFYWYTLTGFLLFKQSDFYDKYLQLLFAVWNEENSVMDHMAYAIVLVTFICFAIAIVSVNFVVFFRG